MRGLPHTAENFKIEFFEARFLHLLQPPKVGGPGTMGVSVCSNPMVVLRDGRDIGDTFLRSARRKVGGQV